MIRFLALILSTLTVWSDAQSQSERICEDGQRSYFGVCPEGNATRPPSPHPAETLLADRYRDHGDGTVTDVKTGLQWMRCSLGQTWRGGTCAGEAERYEWQAALDAAEALNGRGGYAGYRDWRVPTMEELITLVYCSSGQPKTWKDTWKFCEGDYKRPTIYQSAFPNTPQFYWFSASPYASNVGAAWVVEFKSGSAGPYGKREDFAVRLVRGGP